MAIVPKANAPKKQFSEIDIIGVDNLFAAIGACR
jgi:hypothetical protein